MAMSPRLLRPVASGFNPKAISNLALWLDGNDASTITLVSSAVSEWRDKANSKIFAQTTANNRPTLETINGKTALAFGGSKTLSCLEPFTTTPVSMFFVQRVVAHTNFGMTYTAGGSNNFNLRQNASTGQVQLQHPTSGVGLGHTMSTTAAELIALIYADPVGGSAGFANNSLLTIVANSFSQQPIFSGTTHFIGSRDGNFVFNGYIGEILVYTRTVTATERNKISQYLGKKWGIIVA